MRFGKISLGFLALPPLAVLLAVSLRISLGELVAALLATPALAPDVLASLVRVSVVTLFAWALGVIAAGLLWRTPSVLCALEPLVQFMRHVSPFAWLPFAIIWFGLGEAPAVFVLFVALWFPALTSSLTAFESVAGVYREEARMAGASEASVLLRIELPLLSGSLLGMLRVLWGLGWTMGVAVEMLGVRNGVGFRLMDYRYLQQHDRMIAVLLVMGFVGLLVDAVLQAMERKAREIAGE